MQIKQKGFTILEIMIASLIISLVLMGYIQTQMMSIINTEYANKANLVSSKNSDFAGLVSNALFNDETDETITALENAQWEDNNYSSTILRCESEDNLEDVDYCNKTMMMEFIVMGYKENIRTVIPDAEFKLKDCENNDNLCLMVGWNKAELNQSSCKISTSNCLITEISK